MRKLLILLIFLASCVVPYDFTQDSYERFLVVEGYVTDRPGNHRVWISWSSDFNEREFDLAENAMVSVVENGMLDIPFVHVDDGLYIPMDSSFTGTTGNTYSLNIELEGQSYHSDQVPILPCAEIDSVNFVHDVIYKPGEQTERKSLKLQLTTVEDPLASRYYRYFKEETWLSIATESRNKSITPSFTLQDGYAIDVSWDIRELENITYCWPVNESRDISIASTEGLQQNKLVKTDVSSVNLYSDKVLYKYSALIRQLSISKETHHFFSLMKEFSEGDGTLFEVQPGFVEGNIRSVSDPGRKVIGVFYASEVKENRIFIRLTDLDPYYRYVVILHAKSCPYEVVNLPLVDTIPDPALTEKLWLLRDSMMFSRGLVVSDVIFEGLPGTDLVHLSARSCVDCRSSGTNVKPEWWGEIF